MLDAVSGTTAASLQKCLESLTLWCVYLCQVAWILASLLGCMSGAFLTVLAKKNGDGFRFIDVGEVLRRLVS